MTQDLIDSFIPVSKFILFTFPEGVWNNTVSDKTEWGFEFQVSTENTKQPPRWVLVHAAGPQVHESVQPGKYILVEALMWTEYMEHEGKKIWWTSDDKVLAVADERPIE